MITLLLFCFIPVLSAQMDTLDDKYSQYETSYFKILAKFLVKLKIFKTQEVADKFFNKDGLGWTLAYMDGIKDELKPFKNKIMWNVLGVKVIKPAQFVDAWHFFKAIFIFIICLIVTINLPVWFIVVNLVITKTIYFLSLNLIWFILFETTYNNK
jgi:hypothetical protein